MHADFWNGWQHAQLKTLEKQCSLKNLCGGSGQSDPDGQPDGDTNTANIIDNNQVDCIKKIPNPC